MRRQIYGKDSDDFHAAGQLCTVASIWLFVALYHIVWSMSKNVVQKFNPFFIYTNS